MMSAMYMDSSCFASITVNKLRRVRIFGHLVETLSPNQQFMNGRCGSLTNIKKHPLAEYNHGVLVACIPLTDCYGKLAIEGC
jgi:hypothetical protein